MYNVYYTGKNLLIDGYIVLRNATAEQAHSYLARLGYEVVRLVGSEVSGVYIKRQTAA